MLGWTYIPCSTYISYGRYTGYMVAIEISKWKDMKPDKGPSEMHH